ncbi:MAG: CRISPR-associated endonuclease Cas2 [Candidatus Paceibacterota bacterium]
MTLVYEMLKAISETSLSYKGTQVNIFGIPKLKNRSYKSIRSMVSYVKKNNLIVQNDKGWHLSPAGKKYMKRKEVSLKQFENEFTKEAPKNLIVMFDISEKQKAEREWFRWHLKKFNYEMIQRSVWVGPSPLPKEFMNYIEKIKLKDSIKTFKLAKSYKIS